MQINPVKHCGDKSVVTERENGKLNKKTHERGLMTAIMYFVIIRIILFDINITKQFKGW